MREKLALINSFGFSIHYLNSISQSKIRQIYHRKMTSLNAQSRVPSESRQFYNQTSCKVETRAPVSRSTIQVLAANKAEKASWRKPGKARFDEPGSMKGDKFGYTYTTKNGQKEYRITGMRKDNS